MNRRILKTMFATALCLGALASPAFAQISISVDLGLAPPPPRYEPQHQPRVGHVWIPGFWFWEGHRHQWSEGHWERARRGQRWVSPRWEDRGDSHHYEPGRWVSERKFKQAARYGNQRDDHPGRGDGRNDRDGRNDHDGPRENPGRGHDQGRGRN